MTESISVTIVHIDFGRVVVVRQLILVDGGVSEGFASVGVVEMRVLHESKAFGAEAGVGSCAGTGELRLLFGAGVEAGGGVHLGVVGLEGVDVWHEGILNVGV